MILNPTLSIQVWVWSFLSYNEKVTDLDNNKVTKFAFDNMGRYAWVYILAPCVAGIVGGMLAKCHMRHLSKVQNEGKE